MTEGGISVCTMVRGSRDSCSVVRCQPARPVCLPGRAPAQYYCLSHTRARARNALTGKKGFGRNSGMEIKYPSLAEAQKTSLPAFRRRGYAKESCRRFDTFGARKLNVSSRKCTFCNRRKRRASAHPSPPALTINQTYHQPTRLNATHCHGGQAFLESWVLGLEA